VPGAPRILALPPPARAEGVSLWHALTSRRSLREFGRRPLAAEEIAALLWAGQGLTSPEGGRASPSAGALYPTTLTIADGRGLFRYLPRRHALQEVSGEDRRPHLAAAALGQDFVAAAPVTLAVTADPAVLAGRYGDRAERYCVLEAGHVAQNVLLQATALGLAAAPVAAFRDDEVLAALELEKGHLALYLIPAGARPRDPR
jgi:SagB-type dehydrogenase family enzyme